MTMRGFFIAVLAYLAVAILVLWWQSNDLIETLYAAGQATRDYSGTLAQSGGIWVLPGLAVLPLVLGRQAFRARLVVVLYAFTACILLQVAFSILKTAIPGLVPFYADPAFASLDRWLHGGTDPWQMTHSLTEGWPMGALLPFYLQIWTFPATALPVFIAVTDNDRDRTVRFLTLYLGIWIGLGTLLALAGSSVGPVYYDALLGTDRFADLTEALRRSPINGSLLGDIQNALWENYASGAGALGLGISAFPSVHVAIATLTVLYLAERARTFAPIGFLWLALVQFLSVYTGYHYALDGYVSALAVFGAWVVLRRRYSLPLRVLATDPK